MRILFILNVYCVLLFSKNVLCNWLKSLESDWDLEKYISRPDLRPPKFTVDASEEDKITPGYWFVSPYEGITDQPHTQLYVPKQVGPHIYDNQGQLVWSGAEIFPNRNTFNFRATSYQGETSLTFLVGEDDHGTSERAGVGIILDRHFNMTQKVHVAKGHGTVNIHEFNVIDNGASALTIIHQTRMYQSSSPEFSGWIEDLGFVEIDVASGETLFEWWASDHIHPLERTSRARPMSTEARPWDCYHLNSVDKNKDGDYLVSARHTNAIYKISGSTGSIIWQLGGKNSSFTQMGFNFSYQHDARFLSEDKTGTSITFLDNASNGLNSTADYSFGLTVHLDTAAQPMVARVIQRLSRPDKKWTTYRGGLQKLPNGHTFVGWATNSYLTEFDRRGRLVLSAQFLSRRFSTYRAYKFNFTGAPIEPPDVVCSVYGTSKEMASTVCYVSWNGATEVRSWNFWTLLVEGTGSENNRFLGNVARKGFETSFTANGLFRKIFVEALDQDGQSLRNSSIVDTSIPERLETLDAVSAMPVQPERHYEDMEASHQSLKDDTMRGSGFLGTSLYSVVAFSAALGAFGLATLMYLARRITRIRIN